ncbi:MASE1 domain-containing protein [Serratia marcescens]|nr:MASE1 domain-containing protein [Serratia marcescens]
MYKRRKSIIYVASFSFFYFTLAMLCLETRDPWSLSSLVWLPSGLLLGVLCISPRILWPLWGVSSGLLHIIASLIYGRSLDIALVFALVDLAILFPLGMLWKNLAQYFLHDSFRVGTVLILIAIFITSIVGGIACVSILSLIGYPIVIKHFFTWSLSNATGCLTGAVFLTLRLRRFSSEAYQSLSWSQLTIILASSAIFLCPESLIQSPLLEQSLIYVSLSGTLISSISLPQRTLAVYFLYLTILVNLTTLYGYGPLAGNDVQDMQLSQLYLLVALSLGLVLAAHKNETKVHNQKLQQQLKLICNMLEKQQPVFFQLSSDGKECQWSLHQSVFGISPDKIPTLLLLQARIHPKDLDTFTHILTPPPMAISHPQQCIFRLLLSDNQYHTVHCNIISAHPLFGGVGVFMLNDEQKGEMSCGDVL